MVPTAQRLWVSSYSISVSLSYVGDSIGLILSISLLRPGSLSRYLSQQAQTVGEMIETLKDFLILTLM